LSETVKVVGPPVGLLRTPAILLLLYISVSTVAVVAATEPVVLLQDDNAGTASITARISITEYTMDFFKIIPPHIEKK
jgi:hypothetical protein